MRNRAEAQLSLTVYEYLIAAKPRCIYTAIPNGGARSLIEAVNFKRQGVVSGAADWVFTWSTGSGWIELKADKGRPSINQVVFKQWCNEQGVRYAVCRNLDEVVAALKTWGLLR